MRTSRAKDTLNIGEVSIDEDKTMFKKAGDRVVKNDSKVYTKPQAVSPSGLRLEEETFHRRKILEQKEQLHMALEQSRHR